MPQTTMQRSLAFGKGQSFQQISPDNATALGLTVPANAQSCLVSASDQKVRWRVDGNDPTAAIGHEIDTGQYFEFFGDEMKFVKFIAVTGTAQVFVTYYF